jgi:hypothetical protein
MNSTISPWLPLKYEIAVTARLVELVQICDSFDQLTKIAMLADFLINPLGTNHKLLFAAIEQMCLRLRSNPNIGKLELDPDRPCPGCMGVCGACSK